MTIEKGFFEAKRFVNWIDGSVVVSLALSCPASCTFCYVDTIIENEEEVELEEGSLGCALAKEVTNDSRFISGAQGTTIFVGGFTDPVYKCNVPELMAFLSEVLLISGSNIIHISTKFPAKEEGLVDLIVNNKNIVLNYSIVEMGGSLTVGRENILRLFKNAEKLSRIGACCALYVKPVLPGITMLDVPEIIANAKKSNIEYITVGDLFLDERIRKELSRSGVNSDQFMKTDEVFILDTKGVMNKLEGKESEKVKEKFSEAGFTVFSSSREFARYLGRT